MVFLCISEKSAWFGWRAPMMIIMLIISASVLSCHHSQTLRKQDRGELPPFPCSFISIPFWDLRKSSCFPHSPSPNLQLLTWPPPIWKGIELACCNLLFEKGKDWPAWITPWKFNSEFSRENISSQKERIVFRPSFFRGYVKLREGILENLDKRISSMIYLLTIWHYSPGSSWHTLLMMWLTLLMFWIHW